MKLKNILIAVSDVGKSKEFYKTLFGLDVIRDFGENVMLTEGLVLQEKTLFEKGIGRSVSFGSHDAELYFEEIDMDGFLERLDECGSDVTILQKEQENSWGRRVVRLYDPDRHVIEVAEVSQ